MAWHFIDAKDIEGGRARGVPAAVDDVLGRVENLIREVRNAAAVSLAAGFRQITSGARRLFQVAQAPAERAAADAPHK